MQIVAITGSIGCGKTTIADILRGMGYAVYDVDKWCRSLYKKKCFLEKIRKTFPQAFENGKFNKRKLRQIVFSQPQELKKLEQLTHPFLRRVFFNTIHQYSRSNAIIFVDVALLYEMAWDKHCTLIMVADAPYEEQLKRVMARDNVSEAEFREIISVQLDNNQKKQMADVIVNTDMPLGRLKAQLIKIVNGLEAC